MITLARLPINTIKPVFYLPIVCSIWKKARDWAKSFFNLACYLPKFSATLYLTILHCTHTSDLHSKARNARNDTIVYEFPSCCNLCKTGCDLSYVHSIYYTVSGGRNYVIYYVAISIFKAALICLHPDQ